MIKFENTEVLGWEAAIRGMRNPMNSWEKSDSHRCVGRGEKCEGCRFEPEDDLDPCYLANPVTYVIGPNDHKLMMNLAKAGSVDAKYRRMIVVTVDITAPLYWWKEFDTYKVGTVANSCSTMHKIQAKEFTLEDFSHEHLSGNGEGIGQILSNEDYEKIEYESMYADPGMPIYSLDLLDCIIYWLNIYREKFIETKDKRYWWQMIQLLPSSYNQRRTVMLNYEVLAGIYPKRKDHKLDEWHDFCDWIDRLPYSEIITLEDRQNDVKQEDK